MVCSLMPDPHKRELHGHMTDKLGRLRAEQRGSEMVEYVVLVAIVVGITIVSIMDLRVGITDAFGRALKAFLF